MNVKTTPREIITAVKDEIMFLDTVSMDIQSNEKQKHYISFQAAAVLEVLNCYIATVYAQKLLDNEISVEVKF